MLNLVDSPALFWLDGHVDGVNADCLWDELEHIKNHTIKTHTIIVDDVRILGKEGWGTEVVLDKIIGLIKEINPDYTISYDDGECENDVLIAKV